MKKTVKAYVLETVLTIIGIVIGVISAGATVVTVFNNWESHQEIDVTFYAGESSKVTDYYACNSDSLELYQKEGNSTCKYDLYTKSRNKSNYTVIDTNLSFKENSVATAPYSMTSHWWNDVCFNVKKTAGTGVKSALHLSLGKSTD